MTTLSAPAATIGWSCPRCGVAGPVELRPVQTVALIRSLTAHFGTLFRHADPAVFVACGPAPGSRSALDHLDHVAFELTALDRRLRERLRESPWQPDPVGTSTPVPADNGSTPEAVLARLTRTGERLARTIVGATAADWQHAATIGGHRALDLVNLTLHDASHELAETEQALTGRGATGPTNGRTDTKGLGCR